MPKIDRIHHVAYRCRDAKETVLWYGKMLKMDFVLAIAEDPVPSTKEPDPYMHVFLDAGGGVRINEPVADLAILLAVHSSLTGRPLPAKTPVFGEVGLAGEIRPVQGGQERIREAAKLGFRQFVTPTLNKPKQRIDNAKITTVDRVGEAVEWLRG